MGCINLLDNKLIWVMNELRAFLTNKNVNIDSRSVWRDGIQELYITMTIGDISAQSMCYLESVSRSDLHRILTTLEANIEQRTQKKHAL